MDINHYINQIENPSKDFNTFLYDYFTGPSMIRGRVEEDMTVWDRLKGKEYEVAKQMIINNLLSRDSAYIRAAGIFRDDKAIPILMKLIKESHNKFVYERTQAAKILYDWIGYDDYFIILDEALRIGGQYTKTSLYQWIIGIDKSKAVSYIFQMLNDKDSFVRWCAYGDLKRFFNLGKQEYEETKYYTDDMVFKNKQLLEDRLSELKSKIDSISD